MTLKQFSYVVALGTLSLAPLSAQTPIPEARMIQWLSGDDLAAKQAVVTWLIKTEKEPRSSALDVAIAKELTRTNLENSEARAARYRVNVTAAGEALSEYHASLIQVAKSSNRDAMIAPLAGAIASGNMAIQAVIRFGDRALPEIFRIARERQEPDPFKTAGAIRALQLMKEERGMALPPSALASIVDIVRERLTGKQHPAVITAAFGLAVATGDASLRARVQRLADSRDELRGMSVSDDASAKQVQGAARRALGIR